MTHALIHALAAVSLVALAIVYKANPDLRGLFAMGAFILALLSIASAISAKPL
jgi:hypothetical protein